LSKAEVLKWSEAPDEHDYPAAALYLSLVADPGLADALSRSLAVAPTVQQHAKDILRAARLPLLPADDAEVAADLKKVRKGTALSPILLIRGDFVTGRLLQIADGYHRVCASYHLNENTDIPCRLVDLPAAKAGASATKA
jgi:hypothetical protein